MNLSLMSQAIGLRACDGIRDDIAHSVASIRSYDPSAESLQSTWRTANDGRGLRRSEALQGRQFLKLFQKLGIALLEKTFHFRVLQ